MISKMLKLGCFSLAYLFVLTACDEGTIPYFPPPTNDAGDAAVTTPDAAAPIRTIETRNPFGDTSNPTNLMVDGDFELTGRTGQMGWTTFVQGAQTTLDYATGGKCKSGVRCASIAAGTAMIGYFSSPKTGTMNGTLWARPDSGKCNDVTVYALDIDNQSSTPTARLTPAAPDATGWCLFSGSIPNMAEQQPVLYVVLDDGVPGITLVDDGVVLPADSTNSYTRTLVTLQPQERQRVKAIGAWVRAHRKF